MQTRQVHLVSRPTRWPTNDDFRVVEVSLPEPGPGEVVVRNTVMSVDPYMRSRMNDAASYVEPFALDTCLDGGAVGEVLVSRNPGFAGVTRCSTTPGGVSTQCCQPDDCASWM